MARARPPDFIAVVWATGSMKRAGGLLLCAMLRDGHRAFVNRLIYSVALFSGILLFLHGRANFCTVLLATLNLLDMKVDHYARWWRL